MSSGPGRELASGERRNPKPSERTSTTPSPIMSISWIASCLRMANISSCLRMVLAFSTPFSSANATSSAAVWALRSWSLISRIGVVLWGTYERRGCKEAFWNADQIRKSAGLSEESADEASNLMRRPVQQGNRDATTSACVGWEYRQYRKSTEFPQDGVRWRCSREARLKRLNHYQDNDPDHQDGRYLVDTTIKFL